MRSTKGPAPRNRRVLGAASWAALIVIGSSGCLGTAGPTPTACAAILYSQQVDIILDGPAADEVERVVFCTESGCSVPGIEATPVPASGPYYAVTDLGDGRWHVDIQLDLPSQATIEVLGKDGTTLTSTTVELEWQRVGGSEECGGPHEADPIVLTVARAR